MSFQFSGEDGSQLYMNGKDISSEISSTEVTESVSRISAIPMVREKLVHYQREMAEGQDVVLEGRDIGTVVFPNAHHKFFFVADINERARRRMMDMETKGEIVTLEELIGKITQKSEWDNEN